MKKKVSMFMVAAATGLTLSAGADVILAGWEGQVASATTNISDISAVMTWSAGFDVSPPTDDRTGSQDLTFGSVAGAGASLQNTPETGSFRLPANQGDGMIEFSLTNNSSETYILTGFHFDAYRQYPNAPSAFTLQVVSDVSTTTVGSGSFTSYGATVTYNTNYEDLDVELNSHSLSLATGESMTLRLLITDGLITAGAQTYLDNFAVTGVPEPMTAGLLSLSMIGLIAVRRIML